MKKKYAAVAYVDFKKYKRIIVMSDIHGDLDGFTSVLNKVRFSKEDALVIVGGYSGKGSTFTGTASFGHAVCESRKYLYGGRE